MKVKCLECDGWGKIFPEGKQEYICPKCKGLGEIYE